MLRLIYGRKLNLFLVIHFNSTHRLFFQTLLINWCMVYNHWDEIPHLSIIPNNVGTFKVMKYTVFATILILLHTSDASPNSVVLTTWKHLPKVKITTTSEPSSGELGSLYRRTHNMTSLQVDRREPKSKLSLRTTGPAQSQKGSEEWM